ncbi:MAG: ABC transporter substrate-binding protein [Daejeonella sp.]
MILVPNHLRLLSGNKCIVVCILFLLSACSPKITPVKTGGNPQPAEKERAKPSPPPPPKKELDHSIALLLPFELNTIDLKTAGSKEVGKADLAIDFYQGFKLALDSVSANGHNYQLQVFDTQDQETRVVNLARAASVRKNDLIIGPVFPDAISTFSEFADTSPGKLMVSPLAASMPAQFKNPNLITVNNTIDQHGWKIADYINRKYKPEQVNVVLINTKTTDDEKFAAPVRQYLNELSKARFQIVERPNAIGLQTQIKPGKNNLVIVCSSERIFLLPTIDRLFKSSNEGYKIELFGHPNWIKAKFLDAQKMQKLNTKISASYFVNYKAENVKHFIARYRDEFGFEPSEFSFKGFDVGYYFGRLLERHGRNYASHLGDETYKGLHNNFRFSKDPALGFINTQLMILAYRSFELQPLR